MATTIEDLKRQERQAYDTWADHVILQPLEWSTDPLFSVWYKRQQQLIERVKAAAELAEIAASQGIDAALLHKLGQTPIGKAGAM